MTIPPRDVAATMSISVTAPTEIEMQIAVARMPGLSLDETLQVTLDGKPVSVEEIVDNYGGRIHRLSVESGQLDVDYRAAVTTPADPAQVAVTDHSIYLRPSRYAEADKFFGFAAGQFDTSLPKGELLNQVTAFVEDRLDYIPGASDPIDGAADTLLAGAGVCRDYAHLVVALLRALNIPARLVAVYAPGCDPMDFHAVAEALIDGVWVVVDATRLAPRQGLVRISTGRDAADTAFLDNHEGSINLDSYQVTAVVRGDLPIDDGKDRISIG
ncbi:transglutaminase-like protein [Gordonia polyisoprenivorans VH2]|uniref:Transglutaminase-like protein n=2 Tax=Gordonia polyisoprenivorans TaxID=84595 RepID=H6MZQ3_GORPV|nr:transglutaminase family protein [Gordonia polyisoprenivorans]AFA72040.1 transglutaminase-like protein [Gordonia polyisoprenivorans VH2]MBE7194524.1 transglutaminase family protein [Gordonia polyisoprenivorans]QUD81865.1 transglutaminase family protein [Gordonia polyisoprenivorans]UZF57333.1 transglutaminase family protein [Gordonia polyisoprenivorans]WCB38424.1 transglutaminase family protein [Gordonia polyisoprenivorans]